MSTVFPVAILEPMSTVAVPFGLMAKQKKESHPEPDPEVRLTSVMPRSVRHRLRIVALRSNENLEDMSARWLMERLEQEEAPKPRR